MINQKKLFYYSKESVSYIDASWYRIRLFGISALSVLSFLGLLFGLNHFYGDIIGLNLKLNTALLAENKILKLEIKDLTSRMDDLSVTLDKLAFRDNELRDAVSLPRVQNDIRTAGIGGKATETNLGLISKNSADMLTAARRTIQKLESEVSFQNTSYKEIFRKSESDKILFASIPVIRPVRGSIVSRYGTRAHPFLGGSQMHEGIDIHAQIGTPIYSTGDGEVEFSGSTGSGYGIAVEVNHSFGYKSWYAHLSRTVVKPGTKVKRGTIIGYTGNSGLSTGPHLHYEIRMNGARVNPALYFVDQLDYKNIRKQLALLRRR